jgi:hypothetical protein
MFAQATVYVCLNFSVFFFALNLFNCCVSCGLEVERNVVMLSLYDYLPTHTIMVNIKFTQKLMQIADLSAQGWPCLGQSMLRIESFSQKQTKLYTRLN